MSHRESQRRIEELSLRALDSCRALSQKDAIHSLLKGLSSKVLAFSSTVVSLDVSRVALAENLESAPYLDELLPSYDDNLLADDLECIMTSLLLLEILNESLSAVNSFYWSQIEDIYSLDGKISIFVLKYHIVKLTYQTRSTQGFLFTRKKDGRQRMILDRLPCLLWIVVHERYGRWWSVSWQLLSLWMIGNFLVIQRRSFDRTSARSWQDRGLLLFFRRSVELK